jgi:hypothetical protein
MTKDTGRRAAGKSAILSRDPDGNEHLLGVVDHPSGFIAISDDQVIRIMTPSATVALVVALIDALGSYLPVRPGPISGSF